MFKLRLFENIIKTNVASKSFMKLFHRFFGINTAFWISILTLLNWLAHYLFGKTILDSSLINVKTGTRRITCLHELSYVVRPRRRATKDYSSSRILHLVPVAILGTKNQTNCFVCFFTAVAANLATCLSNMPLSTCKSPDNAARFNMSSNVFFKLSKTFSLMLILW